MIRGHAIYEGVYLLGTSIARPLIAKRQIMVAKNSVLMQFHTEQQGRATIRLDLSWDILILVKKLK